MHANPKSPGGMLESTPAAYEWRQGTLQLMVGAFGGSGLFSRVPWYRSEGFLTLPLPTRTLHQVPSAPWSEPEEPPPTHLEPELPPPADDVTQRGKSWKKK